MRRAMLLSDDESPGRKLRIDVEQAAQSSALEVARRWMTFFPPRDADRKPAKVTEEFLKLRADNPV